MQSYQGSTRCLDYATEVAGAPIIINDCEKAHSIVVQELDNGKHTVVLRAGKTALGIKINPVTLSGPPPASSSAETPLQLVNWNPLLNGVIPVDENPFFTLDGDSIILSSNPNMVVRIQNARGAVGSPVVLGPRQLADNEFWDFIPIGVAPADPTNGFIHIGYQGDPYCSNSAMCTCRLLNVVDAAGPGTVVKVDSSIDLTDCPSLVLSQSGVTIRGDGRAAHVAPELQSCYVVNSAIKCDSSQSNAKEIVMMQMAENTNDVRVTGLNLHGPSRSTDEDQTNALGLITSENNKRNIIDHNDVSGWPEVALRVEGSDTEDSVPCDVNSSKDPQMRPTTALIARNFIHHNMEQEEGYGTESYLGAFPLIYGNTFVSNRHSIAAGFGTIHTGYRAWYNLVLGSSPLQHHIFHTQDFDMHGMGKKGWILPGGYGGTGGDYMDIYKNTFLGTNRDNFELRGDPCNYAEFHENISLESIDDAVSWTICNYFLCGWEPSGPANELQISTTPDQFNHSNPISGTKALGVGDFDGDKADDLFLATGEAWYYSPAGKSEWRFLSAKTDGIGGLLFGDFDGDGRTDVVAVHGSKIVVSWGGVSEWDVLNPSPANGGQPQFSDASGQMIAGRFSGKAVADIFWADGHTWWISYGGTSPFKEIQTSGFGINDLRFGDFNGDGRTDVFSVGSKNWQVSYAPSSGEGLFSSWQSLRKKLTDSATSLVVADFDGDGVADVAADCGDGCWQISYGGQANWTRISQPVSLSTDLAGIGHFNATKANDVLTWNTYRRFLGVTIDAKCDNSHGQDTQLCISLAASGRATHYSTQDMR